MRTIRKTAIFLSLVVTVACATGAPPEGQESARNSISGQKPFVIGAGDAPAGLQVSEGNLPQFSGPVEVPAGTLRISKVSRKRSEMREGPGVSFALADRILEEGARVIVFEQHGVWAKVLSIGHWDSGWVHVDSISPPKLNRKSMRVDFGKFPTVLAVRPVSHGLAFVGGSSVRFDEAIPKGRMFRALQMTEDRTLIWISERNDIVWIKGKDMQ